MSKLAKKVYNAIKLDDVKDSQGDPRVSYTEASNGTRTYIRLIKDGQIILLMQMKIYKKY